MENWRCADAGGGAWRPPAIGNPRAGRSRHAGARRGHAGAEMGRADAGRGHGLASGQV